VSILGHSFYLHSVDVQTPTEIEELATSCGILSVRKRSDSNNMVLSVRKRSDSNNMVLSVRKRSDSNNRNNYAKAKLFLIHLVLP